MKKKFSDIAKQLLGQKYEFGKVDCFALVLQYCELIGKELKQEHDNHNIRDYGSFYPGDLAYSERWLEGFMEENFEEIEIGKAFVGDIILMRLNGSFPFLGIKGGNGRVIAATKEYGVRVLPLKPYTVERAFKCQL